MSVVAIIWVLYGYSMAFSEGGAFNAYFGGFSKAFLVGVTPESTVETFTDGVVIPEYGGDTQWTNLAAAYRYLSEPIRTMIDGLHAVHHNVLPPREGTGMTELKSTFQSKDIRSVHPVVRVHPETGERSLVLGHFVKRILGVSAHDSAHLFQVFQEHVTRLENTVRWRWAVGDVAVWDNRSTQHYAVNDYGDQHRVVRRVTVDGDVPVSVDGKRSVARSKTPRQAVAA